MTRPITREWCWRFSGHPPEAIWPSLADTARFNEAAGLPKHEIEEIPQTDGSVAYFGRCRMGPYRLRWREHPVNWIQDQWFEHRRSFETGPLRSLCARLALVPNDDGCDGHYAVTAEAAGPVGQAMLRSGLFFERSGTVFARLADQAREFASGLRERPFETRAPRLARGTEERVSALVASIEATTYGHGLAARLAELVLRGSEVDLWQIRPRELARRWGRAEREVIELCLQAVRSGLLELRWQLLCPRCRVAKATVQTLDRLPTGAHCSTCNIDYEREFTRNVEAAFRPTEAVRSVAGGEYCLFGPMSTPHIKVHVTLEPGETRRLEARLPHGRYRLRTLEPGDQVEIDWLEGGFPTIEVDGDERVLSGPAAPVGEVWLSNRSARTLTLIAEQRDWLRDALTADSVTAIQAFRDLFADDVLRPGDEVGIGRVALMFTDLKGSTALYERIGDAIAYGLVRDHFASLVATIRAHDGAVVKTIGDAVMASFGDPADALRAALAIQTAHRRGDERDLTIKLGLHCGPCIAVTLNDRLDYFGSTVNLAARLQNESVGGDIVLSREVATDPGVGELLADHRCDEETAMLRGFDQAVPFLRVIPATPAPADPSSVRDFDPVGG